MPDTRKYSDRAAYLKMAVKRRRQRLRDMARSFKGGKCKICGYNKCSNALEFHHRDPKKKDFGLSVRGLTRSWEKVRKETEKCELICANCHREIHAGLTQLPKET
jgi:5-methylcytosine-specific restriction endonuclease McrA